MRIDAADLIEYAEGRKGGLIPSDNCSTAQPTAGRLPEDLALASGQPGLTFDRYATAKRLPIDFLKTCGLSEFTYDHKPAVRILLERMANKHRWASESRSLVIASAGSHHRPCTWKARTSS